MVDARAELDTKDMSPEDVRARVDALDPGAALVLVSSERADGLVEELLEDAPGHFEWSHLEAGPERARLEVRRRAAPGPRTVTSYLGADHDRLDGIVPEVERHARASAFAEARACFAEFACGLDWHIDVEEQLLFPLFEAKTGMTHGPTTVMRAEHVDIRAAMKRVEGALAAGDLGAMNDAMGQLTGILASHNAKEERMLYPMLDNALLEPEAQERVVRRIEAF
jgi:uncharacterized protein (DUF2249 family)